MKLLIILILIVLLRWWYLNPKIKEFTINGGQFDQDINVIITEDTSYALNFIRKNLDTSVKSEDLFARGLTFESIDGKPIIVWLSDANDIGVNNHELLHATIALMKWANVPYSGDTEEVYAYQLQYLSNQFYNNLK